MPTEVRRRHAWAGGVLGFALGGFFDGILLHQILQWHHLLSAIDREDIRFQVAADGYFHALMYLIGSIGIWMLWRSRDDSRRASGRLLFAAILIGFGTWHIVDAMLSHWLLGIHRIRMDSASPLFWDLLWLGLFGVVPLIIGRMMSLPGDDDGAPVSRSPATARLWATLLVLGASALSFWPLRGSEFTTIMFPPGVGQERIFRAIAAVDAQLMWMDHSGELLVVRLTEGRSGWKLFGHGAILVAGAGLPPGCFTYLRT